MKVKIISEYIDNELNLADLENSVNKFLENKPKAKQEWKQSGTGLHTCLIAIITYS